MAPKKGFVPANKIDRTGIKYGKVTALRLLESGKWLCKCDCGNETVVSSCNMASMAKSERGCRHCANRKDIKGERRGLVIAVETEAGAIAGRHPIWSFLCDCGNSIKGTVREFHGDSIRSCGCHDSVKGSWESMMSRCYNEKHNRYQYYGGRGIKVCKRWHSFNNFVADMGERPKRHNLGRKHAEKDYCKSNCSWEHVSKNGPDTCKGIPTRPGLLKGAKSRVK